MPSHEQVRFAVALQGHPEFTAWTENPDNYTLMLSDKVALKSHRLFFVTPHHLRHPKSFYAAFDSAGNGLVTTQNPSAVGSVLATEAEGMSPEDLQDAIVELLRGHHHSAFIAREASDLPDALQERFAPPTHEGDLLRFQVLLQGQPAESWTFAMRGEDSVLERQQLDGEQ